MNAKAKTHAREPSPAAAAAPDRFAHTLIRASAGTGKTFQLTNRYLALLAAEQRDDTILATTFTRKAAGEILERVLLRLADAALDDEKLKELRKAIPAPELDAEACLALLSRVLGDLHRLRIGTLDHFFQQIARSFSLELGLPPGWQIAEPLVDRRLQVEAIREVLDEQRPGDAVRLMHLLTKATAQRSVARQIADLVSELHSLYAEAPPEAWHALPRPKRLTPLEVAQRIEQLAAIAPPQNKSFAKGYAAMIDAALQCDWRKFLENGLVGKLLAGETTYYRAEIPAALIEAGGALIAEARAEVIGQIADQTEATFTLLERFDRAYLRLKQTQRGLRFDDVTRALAAAMSRAELTEVAHRLDARLEHMLLDEFQDTAVLQWRVLRPLAQAVTASPRRLFFCVGDVKQAIYRWRGGVAEIFDVLARDLGSLGESPLDCSWRSAPPVIECVNQVFLGLAANPATANFPAAAEHWGAQFHPHTTAKTELRGHCRLVTAPRAAADEKQLHGTLRFAAAEIARLHRAAPRRSIGVLTRQNDTVARVIFELKQLGVEASEEGGNPLSDSAAVQLALSLLRLADHPGDTAARYHVAHSPLAERAGVRRYDDPAAERVSLRLRRQLTEAGYGPALEEIARGLAPHCDRRDLDRLRQLVEKAYVYQPQATLRVDDFIAWIESERVPAPRPSPIRVMTLHQAKGLQFDIVVLCDLDRRLLGQPGSVVFDRGGPGATVTRICRYVAERQRGLLPGEFQRMFDDYRRQVLEEAFCVLYVALTRAVHALHMIIAPSRENEQKLPGTAAGILRGALTDGNPAEPNQTLYEIGDAEWLTDGAAATADADSDAALAETFEAAEPPPLAIRLADGAKRPRRRLESRTPSQLEGGPALSLTDLLRLEGETARGIGTLVHRWCAEIGWLDDGLPDEAQLRLLAAAPEYRGLDRDAAWQRFRDGLQRPAVAAALRRAAYAGQGTPEAPWRERPFAVRDGEVLLHGRFDRVVLLRQGARCTGADVLDFKTDRVAREALPAQVAVYAPQMAAYRRALSLLLDLPEARISARLVFLELGEVVAVN